jgi:predicted site-specific integrase-resolvase
MTIETPDVIAVDPRKAGPLIGVAPETLKDWRRQGIGPAYCRIGNRVRYRISDLEAWLAEHAVTPGLSPPQRD